MRMYSNDIKLDYKDVLIVPQRSDISSRTKVDLVREFRFKHSPHRLKGIGVIAAKMDSVGTFAIAKALAKHNMFTALHKHYGAQELVDFFKDTPTSVHKYIFCSMGLNIVDIGKIVDVR